VQGYLQDAVLPVESDKLVPVLIAAELSHEIFLSLPTSGPSIDIGRIVLPASGWPGVAGIAPTVRGKRAIAIGLEPAA